MSKQNPLHDWLGIADDGRPVDYYRLLGLERFEAQVEEIEAAYLRRLALVESHRTSERERAEKLLTLLQQARDHLLRPADKSRYDAKLRALDQPSPASTKPRNTAASADSLPWKWIAGGVTVLLLIGAAVTFSVVRLVNALTAPIVVEVDVGPPVPPIAAVPSPPPTSGEEIKSEPTPDVETEAPAPSLSSDTPAATTAPEAPENNPPVPATTPAAEPMPKEIETAALPETVPGEPPTTTEVKEESWEFTGGNPPPPPAIDNATKRAEYVAEVRAMLEAGLARTPNREQARMHFEKALTLCESDPRLFFGYALVIHPLQRDEAKKQLLRAMNQTAHPYPPAWRLLIDQELKKSLDSRLIKGLTGFAGRLEETAHPWPDEVAKNEFAFFLGRVVGFAKGAGGGKNIAQDTADVDKQIAAALTGSHRAAYEGGKYDAQRREERLAEEASRKDEKSDQVAKVDATDNETKKQELKDNEQKLVRKKEEFDDKWDKLKAEFQRDWNSLESQFRILAEQAKTLALNSVALEQQMDFKIRAAMATKGSGNSGPTGGQFMQPVELMRDVDNLKVLKTQIDLQLQTVTQKAQEVALKAQSRLHEISRAEAEYQAATGQLVKESGFIADARKTLDVQANRLKKAKPTVSKVAKSSTEVKRFANYAPLDVQAEKKRILESYVER